MYHQKFLAVCLGVAIAPAALSQTLVTTIADSTNTDPQVWYENDVRTGGTAGIVDLTGLGATWRTVRHCRSAPPC